MRVSFSVSLPYLFSEKKGDSNRSHIRLCYTDKKTFVHVSNDIGKTVGQCLEYPHTQIFGQVSAVICLKRCGDEPLCSRSAQLWCLKKGECSSLCPYFLSLKCEVVLRANQKRLSRNTPCSICETICHGTDHVQQVREFSSQK